MSALPISPTSAVPLGHAALCLDCNSIATHDRDQCPACGSQARMMLAPVLNRTTLPGDATMYADAGTPATIFTYSGREVQPLNAKPSDICIEDIAHGLSQTCRFGGHTRRFYSVAEHSIYVARMVPPEQRLAALLHDAAEAYLLDLPKPLKVLPEFAAYRVAEEHLLGVIGEALGFDPHPSFELLQADHDMLRIEMNELLHKTTAMNECERHVGRLQCRFAHVETSFLNAYDEYSGVRRGRIGMNGSAHAR